MVLLTGAHEPIWHRNLRLALARKPPTMKTLTVNADDLQRALESIYAPALAGDAPADPSPADRT